MDFLLNWNKVARSCLMVWLVLNTALFCFGAIITETEGGEGVPPSITHELNPIQTVRAGTKHFRLHCPVKGDPEPMVFWSKDGQKLRPSWIRFRTGNNDKTLRIKNLIKEDSGKYECEATNGFGTRIIEYTLVVYGKDEVEPTDSELKYLITKTADSVAPFWVNPSEIRELTSVPIIKAIGSEIILRCQATGNPSPDVQWFKNDVPLHTDSYRWQIKKQALHLMHMTPGDTARYTCRVFNIYGVLNATFRIKVTDGNPSSEPEFEKSHPLNSTVRQGQIATFQCKVRSSVPPNIKWLKRVDGDTKVHKNQTFHALGMALTVLDQYPSETISRPNSTYLNRLVIPHVMPKDSGWYICVVTNPAGHMVYRSAHLNVIPSYEQRPIGEELMPMHLIIGIPVAVILLLIVGYSIYFLHRHKQKPRQPVPCRPPPPAIPPPSLPSYKGSPSPNGYYRTEQRYVLNGNGAPREYYKTALMPGYQQFDPQACAPLKGQYSDDNQYESTPQPYEIRWNEGESDIEFDRIYPEGRLQPYPSMYSCR